ncbi:hypothetical protein Tco_0069491 [Tanacetum coccineum]
MFDIDYLTDSMNYIPVSLENQANPHAGTSEVTNNAGTSQTPNSNASEEKDEEAIDVDVHLYRSMIGSLMYLTASRPDIMYAVCVCSCFQVTPKISHLNAVKRIFKYLKGKLNLGLWYLRESPFNLEAFFDIQTENKHPYLAVTLTKKIFGNMKRGFRGAPRPLLPAMLLVATTNLNAGQERHAVAQSQPSLSTLPAPSTSSPPVQTPPPTSIPTPIPASIPIPTPIPTPTPMPETEPEPLEHTFEEPSPAHQHFSPYKNRPKDK